VPLLLDDAAPPVPVVLLVAAPPVPVPVVLLVAAPPVPVLLDVPPPGPDVVVPCGDELHAASGIRRRGSERERLRVRTRRAYHGPGARPTGALSGATGLPA